MMYLGFPTEAQKRQWALQHELDNLGRLVRHPVNFALRGELPHSDHVGWSWKTSWFYASLDVQRACCQRRDAARVRMAEITAVLRRNYSK